MAGEGPEQRPERAAEGETDTAADDFSPDAHAFSPSIGFTAARSLK